ncbi:hypothetical protein O0L34_g18528 [Tuta absoluta]|nr:hypothetical protein O0L34_g18528 [Tuta absoluta]
MRASAVLWVCLCVCLFVHAVIASRVILVENAPTCFRRVLAGKRALRSFVRKVIPCERLEDCRRECAEQRRFHCESFNYKLDPSFRGKGLCEMMTKPIEAFDIQRDFVKDKDYDFYELDRNSLEPHCPETLRGPGLLHSGFLSSKPHMESYQSTGVGIVSSSGWDRNDWYDRGSPSDRPRFDDRRGSYGGGRRRYEEPFFVPYQIGMARSNDDQESWGQYGGTYGRSYYKDRNDYHKSMSHWGLNDLEPPLYGVRPLGGQNFNYHDLGNKVHRYGYGAWKRGRFGANSSGSSYNGLDYGESSYFKPPKPVFHASGESEERSDEVVVKVKDCSSRRKPGMSLGSGAIRRSLHAQTVVQCESACFRERDFKCVSYSYRYSNSHGSDNCFLSERPYRGLDLAQDSGSDVYAMPEHHGCPAVTTKPFVESECFWHVRSGAAVDGAAVRAALTVAGLGACEAECIRAHTFFCRGFSFRFNSPTIGDDLENCILTSTPPTSLEAGHGLRSNGGHELYARGNYGRGCEPALYDDVQHKESGECYLQYDNAAKLIGAAVKGSAKVRDEQSCGKACTDAPFRCLSFSYNNNAPPETDNCLLSEIRLFDLQRGVDYEHSTDDWLFAFDLFNGQCWRKVHGKGDYDKPAHELPRPLSPPSDGFSSSAPSGPSSSGASGPIGSSGPSGPTGYLPAPVPPEAYVPSGPPTGPYKPSYPGPGAGYLLAEPPGYLPKPGFEPSGGYRPSGPSLPRPSGSGYLPSGPDTFRPSPQEPFRPSRPAGPVRPEYPDTGYGPPPAGHPGLPDRPREEPIAVSWRHYTVSGFPCRQGTSCAQNQVAGHWSCEPEGGEIGAWDYCCAPTHRCGYSEGFHKPWCYVGPSEDQWRPCSEKYYPYHQHNIPHPSQGPYTRPGRPIGPTGPPGPPPLGPLGSPPIGPPGPPPLGPPGRIPPGSYERPDLSYLPEADRHYWDDLYNNGPKAYYDKYGNPLPGYTRVPTANRPYIKYSHNPPRPPTGQWVPVTQPELDPPIPGGLGVPRYWPVAYLHKESPPNTKYLKYNQTERPVSSTTERYYPRPSSSRDRSRDDHNTGDRDRDHSRDDYDTRDRDRDHSRDDYDTRERDRDHSRDYYDTRDRDRDNSRDDYNTRDRDTDTSRDNNRDGNRKHDRNYNTNYDRQNNNYDREPTRRIDDAPSRDYDRESNKNYDRQLSRERDPSRSNNRDSQRDYDRDRSRDGDRDDSSSLRDYSRDKTPLREKPAQSFTNVDPDKPTNNNIDANSRRHEKTRNITNVTENMLTVDSDKINNITSKSETKVDDLNKTKSTDVENIKTDEKDAMDKESENLKGIDGKIEDFSKSIEVLDIEDAKKGEKFSDLKTLEAEERQIEAIGRLVASRRGQQLVLEKRSQKDLESKSIALDKDLVDFNFGNRFPASNVERRGTVQRVTKEELARDRLMDKSLEVSETTFVRPPRILSTTENIRKAIVNGKIFYSASVNQKDTLNNNNNVTRPKVHTNTRRDLTNSTRKAKSLRPLEERAPSILSNANYGKKKVVRTRNVNPKSNVNPVRKVRRVYRRKYNPDEVRRRLLEREKSMREMDDKSKP